MGPIYFVGLDSVDGVGPGPFAVESQMPLSRNLVFRRMRLHELAARCGLRLTSLDAGFDIALDGGPTEYRIRGQKRDDPDVLLQKGQVLTLHGVNRSATEVRVLAAVEAEDISHRVHVHLSFGRGD